MEWSAEIDADFVKLPIYLLNFVIIVVGTHKSFFACIDWSKFEVELTLHQ